MNIEEMERKTKELAELKKAAGKKTVVNAGLLKAGKSTLFNAFAGKTVFASDVVRATVKNDRQELEAYFLMDTPGLDAVEEDTQEALAGYADADVIIFVHNMQEGELNQTEIDSIRQICGLFDSSDAFFKHTILALTHKDQVEDRFADICSCIQAQCEKILNSSFSNVFCVDSASYLKGVQEGKELLKQDSGIPELLDAVDACVSQEGSLRESGFAKKKKELMAEIDAAITELGQMMPKEDAAAADMEAGIAQIQKAAEEAVQKVRGWDTSFSKLHSYRYCGQAKNYKEYDSKSAAESAGKTAINAMIEKAAKAVRSNALSHVEHARNCIDFAKIPKEMMDSLSDAYEIIRQDALSLGVAIKTNFTVTLRDPSSNSDGYSGSKIKEAESELREIQRDAKNLSTDYFSSASDYASRYSSSLHIDYDYRDKWVKGLFGRETCKKVCVYQYDIDLAMDHVANRAEEIEDDIRDRASEALGSAPRLIRADLEQQFMQVVNSITAELEDQMKDQKKHQQEIQKKKSGIRQDIDQLKTYQDEVRSM